MLDILSIGDATLDTFIIISDATVQCTLVTKTCQLCLDYASKIPINRLDQKIGGNALNNAVGSARLGLRAGFYSVIGDDATGKTIISRLKKENISLKYLQVKKQSHTNYSVVLNFKGERTILTYSYPRLYRLPANLEACEWLYYTAIGKRHARLESQILKFARRHRAKLVFNPGTIHLKEGVKGMLKVLRQTEILFVNREEAMHLVGDSADIWELLYRLKNLGPNIVVITDGSNGAYAYNGYQNFYLPIFPVKVVEKTGAGDAFATGFISALFHGHPIAEAMRWGAANSASAITKIGPQDGLLKTADMRQWLRRYKNIKTKVMHSKIVKK